MRHWRVERLFVSPHHFRRWSTDGSTTSTTFPLWCSFELHANLTQAFTRVYSYRNATMGSTFEARRAGM
jgi:hypothetical protein